MMNISINFKEFKNGVVIINTTPHPLAIQDTDGSVIEVPTSVILNAKPEEVPYDESGLFVTTRFNGTPEGEEIIENIRAEYSKQFSADHKLVIIGSIIAAQAYPGKVAGMTPVPGYERVAPSEKRMRCDKFTMYEKEMM